MLQTVDADVIQQWEEATAAAVLAAITAACGSSFFLSSAADAAADLTEADADAAETTAACGSSFFSSSAADVISAADADATAKLLFTPYGCSSNGIRPLKFTFGEGPDARQPLLLWPDTVQRGARCRVNSYTVNPIL